VLVDKERLNTCMLRIEAPVGSELAVFKVSLMIGIAADIGFLESIQYL
jgi:hypothetical protein